MVLELHGDKPLVLCAGASTSRSEVRRQGGLLAERLRTGAVSRLMVASDNPARLLAAIHGASLAGADLWIVSGTVADENLKALARGHGIGLLLTDAGECQWDVRDSGATGCICLLTSGTTGQPKIVAHTLGHLAMRALAAAGGSTGGGARWLLTYQPSAVAGMQVILTAACTDGVIVTAPRRNYEEWFQAARRHQVTHISGTPTFWRGFLMLVEPGSLPDLRQATLGGEAIDQATLDRLRLVCPDARITHIYASTEAGVVFSVNDGKAGFPAAWLGQPTQGAELRIRDGILEVRTSCAMLGYLSAHQAQYSADGWLITGDRVEISEDRVRFIGRQDSVVNVGGSKVHPYVVESCLLACDNVLEARVYGKPNPITGAVLCADLVVPDGVDRDALRDQVMSRCRERLSNFEVPRVWRFVHSIPVSLSGKKA
jgi:acyl-coenzyme A synthetase/AMP-(fatty) acid ligase